MRAAHLDRFFTTSCSCSSVVLLAAIALASGCAAPGPRGELPFGEWSGRGTLAYEAWPKPGDGEQEPKALSIHRSYPTTLSIRPGKIGDREIIEVEILSERGRLGEDEEDTRSHLRLALVQAKRVSDATVLYRVVDFKYNPGPDAELRFNDDAPPVGATCTDVGDARVFQIPYMEGFFDTIRFRANRAEKWGVFFDKDSGLIHWAETLTRND
ncbi:MAG TPA: hypothetical protein VM243_16960 [Phycisphaerae bacterium]|nr:hypothetical protein [Phycisphaerae bacterium]